MLEFFIPAAHAQAQGGQQSSPMVTLFFFAGLMLLMYFMLIRPQRKRQKEHQDLVGALGKGDEVVMTSGMLGKITTISDDYISIDTGSVELKFQRVAVHAVLPKGTIKGIK